MTRYDFTKAMSKYAKRDRQNRKEGYSISLFQNDEASSLCGWCMKHLCTKLLTAT